MTVATVPPVLAPQTEDHPNLLKFLLRYYSEHGPGNATEITTVHIDRDVEYPLHKQHARVGVTSVIHLGRYLGGRTWVEEEHGREKIPDRFGGKPLSGFYHDSFQKFIQYDPSKFHIKTEEFLGCRYGLTFFKCANVSLLSSTDWASCRRLGLIFSSPHGLGIDVSPSVLRTILSTPVTLKCRMKCENAK